MNDGYRQILAGRQNLDAAERAFLKKNGWTYTCQTPGAYWLWQRTLADGRIVLVPQALAVDMEERSPSPVPCKARASQRARGGAEGGRG